MDKNILDEKKFHRKRRTFIIINDKLIVAKKNLSYSHWEWSKLNNFVKSKNDFNELVRGFVDSEGVYFYKGNNFSINKKTENIFFRKFNELFNEIKFDSRIHVFGGMIKQKRKGKYPPKKDYGTTNKLLKKCDKSHEQGKFIAVYGINGIGKTTQIELLVEYLRSIGKNASGLKYPIYDLKPEGPFIYKYLRDVKFRKRNELSTHQLQKKYADNRKRYEKVLLKRLKNGEWIIAEDYIGTGIAWGLAWGGDLEYLEKVNKDLFKEDLSILMHGDRFTTAIEKNHRNETEEEKIKICKNFYLLLAEKYGWKIVDANQKKGMEENIKKVRGDLRKIIKNELE